MQLFKPVVSGFVAMMLVAACGGAATSPTAASRTSAPTSAPGASASAPSVAATQPAAAATPSSPAGTASGTADACALLSSADLNTATGKTYLAGTLDAAGQCNWNTDDSGVGASSGDLIVLAVQPEPLDFIKSSFGSGGVDATVNGHAAFWNPTEGLQSMWVDIGGGNLLVLSFPRSTDLTPADQAIAQKLAETAVGNI